MANDRTIYVYADWENLPDARLTLNISEDDNSLDLELALSVIPYFRISRSKADTIIREVKKAASRWRTIATSIGLSKREQDLMEGAFQ